jgi:phosphatidylglycerol:prolipoprotein diacylglycerol transferase
MVWLGFSGSPNRQIPRSGQDTHQLDQTNVGISALIGGLIFARLAFVGLHLPYYRLNPFEILALWEGGLNATGGVLGAVLGVILLTRGSMQQTWRHLDELALPGLILAITTWIGCWFDGVAYGIQVPLQWGWLMNSDPFVGQTARWPTQMIGTLLVVLSFIALLRVNPMLPPGATAGLAVSAIALSMLFVGFFRADPSLLLLGQRLDILGPAALTMVGVFTTALCCFSRSKSRS